MSGWRWMLVVGMGAGLLGLGGPAGAQSQSLAVVRIDGCEDPTLWTAHPADGVFLKIGGDAGDRGRSLRLDFRFDGGGYAVARRALDVDLPENYAFSFRIRGRAPVNHLEFKLLDASGENVWWHVKRDFAFPDRWETVSIKKRQIQFAWGPLGGGEVRHLAALEIVVTAGTGGEGTVWVDEIELRELPPPGAVLPPPTLRASSITGDGGASLALDGDATTAWRSKPADRKPWIALDFGTAREYGGLTVHWIAGAAASDYTVESSEDGRRWRTLRKVEAGNGGRDDLLLTEAESRHLRVHVGRTTQPVGIAELVVRPLEWSATRNDFFAALAAESPRGSFPRAFLGEQSFWTVAGVDEDTQEALLDEDGRVELGRGRASIEPFLWKDGKLRTWSDARTSQSLEPGALPIPTTRLVWEDLELAVTAFGSGTPDSSVAIVRYRATNLGHQPFAGKLFLALRPFQVNPPAQFLNGSGGATPVRTLQEKEGALELNGEPAVLNLSTGAQFGATSFDRGDIVIDFLSAGTLPPQTSVTDAFEAASGAWEHALDLAPGASQEIDLVLRLHPGSPLSRPQDARAWVQSRFEAEKADWNARLGRVTVRLPPAAAPLVESLRAQLGWVLVNRAGPAIQPGTRAYARSWIRDGSLTSTALLRLGHPEAARAFLEWFAPHQYPSGKIPCVVDHRGADPVPEHDSSGEFIYLVAETYRHTGDRALAERILPRVFAAAGYLDSLRQERRTPEYAAAEKRHFFGLLPPSISHEGYSAKPMHSYWDDFWAVRGFRDAAFLAATCGREEARAHWAAVGAEFERDLAASVRRALEVHSIDFIPGCADVGDFDATSTTIALSPTGAASLLPADALRSTFEQYLKNFQERRQGGPWEAFTPYELRNIGAFVRLGWRDRIPALLDFFLESQRPTGWRQWPEVVYHDTRRARFLGDLPHTWCGTDFVRSFLDLLAYERESDNSLVLGAGAPLTWLEGDGIEVRALRTYFGELTYSMRGDDGQVTVRIEAGLRIPPGGIVVHPPTARAFRNARIDGRDTRLALDGSAIVRALPATLQFRP